MNKATIEKITSKDGTEIAAFVSGRGQSLVLVHGTTADHSRWDMVRPHFEDHFTVWAIDRRGRGASGDAVDYAIEREAEDVAAVVQAIGGPVHLLGHSYGALCSLEASLKTTNLRKLVLYEPPWEGGSAAADNRFPAEALARIERLLEGGDREGAVTDFFTLIVHMPAHEMELMKAPPGWQVRLAAAHTIPRETLAEFGYRFDPRRFAELYTPTLLLMGGESPDDVKQPIRQLDTILPNSRIVEMAGQQHIAMTTATDLFAEEVMKFLLDPAV